MNKKVEEGAVGLTLVAVSSSEARLTGAGEVSGGLADTAAVGATNVGRDVSHTPIRAITCNRNSTAVNHCEKGMQVLLLNMFCNQGICVRLLLLICYRFVSKIFLKWDFEKLHAHLFTLPVSVLVSLVLQNDANGNHSNRHFDVLL